MATNEKTDGRTSSRERLVGEPTRDDHVEAWWLFGIATAALFAAGIILPAVLHDGGMFWPLTIVGAFVITALMSAAAVPHLHRHH